MTGVVDKYRALNIPLDKSGSSHRTSRSCSQPHAGGCQAKGQVKSSKDKRKPKAEKPPKLNASNPSTKGKPADASPPKH